MRRARPVYAALCAVAAFSGAARAADEALVLRMSAERLAAEDRCEEAIERARRARALAPGDAAAAAVEGRCALRLLRYEEAARVLADARRLDPGNAEVAIELLMAQYHLGDRVAAEQTLVEAERLAPDDARVALYKGLLLSQRAEDPRAAAEALERAGRLDPSADPYASYYAGLAWQRANERQRARDSLERARERAGAGPWAAEAERALSELDAGVGTPGAWVRAMVGMEYDDNVTLRANDVSQPNDISGKKDGRGVWAVRAGVELFRDADWAGGVNAGYTGNAHFELHRFDLQYPNASLYLDRRVDDQSFLRLQPYAGYAWTETDPYLAHVGSELNYYRGFDEAGSGRLWTRVGYQDFLFSIQGPGDDPNRDGMEYLGGYDHALTVAEGTTLRGGVLAGAYVAEGRDYDYYTGGAHLGVHQLLPWQFELDVSAGFAYEPYLHESTYRDAPSEHTDRIDKVWVAEVELERPITDWLKLSGRYRYRNNESNTAVFDYDRNIVGGYLTFFWTQ